MKALSSHSSDTLHWVQPKALARRFELRNDDDVFAALEFRSSLGTLAVAETAEGNWSFKRVGFLHARVTVRLEGNDTDIAVYHPKFLGGGTIELANGAVLHWKSANFWATKWSVLDADGEAIVDFSQGVSGGSFADLFKTQATVNLLGKGAKGLSQVALVSLGMYLLLLQASDASTAATVAATS
jgi:hypothetical protein